MKTTTRAVLATLLSTLALSAVACDQPVDAEESLRFAPEQVAEMMEGQGFEDEAAALLAAVEAGEDIPDQAPATLELELTDDADPAASFPSLSECFAAYCIDPTPGVMWSGQCSPIAPNVIYPGACVIMPDADAVLPGCSAYTYMGEHCSILNVGPV